MKNSRHYLELLGISQFISKEGKEQRQVTASIVHQQPDTELDPWALPWGGVGQALLPLDSPRPCDGELLYLQPEPVARHGPADGAALEGGKLARVDLHVLNPQEVGGSGYMERESSRY